MKIRLEDAKNGSITCVADGRFLHSKYNPENEALNFVNSIKCDYSPSCVIITGPCLSYCIPFLQKEFPNTPLYAIQYDSFFLENASFMRDCCDKWAKIFLCTANTSPEQLCEEIFSVTGENILSAALLASWDPADQLFLGESKIAWKSLKLLLQKNRDIIATRSYFSLRWLKNTVQFCLHAQNVCIVKPQTKPVLIVASGPSLLTSLSQIKKYRNKFFILALSSALTALIEHKIYPDLCISTDGGFYAKRHLFILKKLNDLKINIPLAVSAESNIPLDILEHCNIMPLNYGDGIESLLLSQCKIPSVTTLRNGTVSGTAASLALSLTEDSVFACGLDLTNGKGYTHTQPNALEIADSLVDFRLNPLSNRLCKDIPIECENKGGNALDLYRQWFLTRDTCFTNRFYRLSADDFVYANTLGKIQDIHWADIKWDVGTDEINQKTNFEAFSIPNQNERKKIILSIIEHEHKVKSKLWYEYCALAEYLATKKYPESLSFEKKLREKIKKSFSSLQELCL